AGPSRLTIGLTNQTGSTVELLGSAAVSPQTVTMDGLTIVESDSFASFQSASGDAWFYDAPSQALYLQDLQGSGTSTVTLTLPGGSGNTRPTANPVSVSATTATPTPWTPSFSDPDVGDPHTCSIVTQPSNGTAT